MNDVIKNILNRRSIRVYSAEQIKREDLELILKSAIFSPSACNTQPWHFTVVQNKDIINLLSTESKKEFVNHQNETFKKMAANENFNIFYNAPTIIVISGEKASVEPKTDCAAATENMLLAAESLGIGTCWIGLVAFLFRSERASEFIKLLQIPDGYEPYYAITLGYKKYDNPKPQPRRDGTINYLK